MTENTKTEFESPSTCMSDDLDQEALQIDTVNLKDSFQKKKRRGLRSLYIL